MESCSGSAASNSRDTCATCHAVGHGDSGESRNEGIRDGVLLGVSVAVASVSSLASRGVLWPGAPAWVPIGLFALAYIAAGYDVLAGAARNLLRVRPLDELSLMTVSTLGAFFVGHPEEAVGVMVFYKVGEMLQESASRRSRSSIRSVLALRPDSARVVRNGAESVVKPEDVSVGELVRARPGERVPLDGVVESGDAWLDTSALTGESAPRSAGTGTEVLAGAIVQEGVLSIRVARPASGSYAARIVDLVENATRAKTRTERFITRFARWYTPAVVGVAAALAVLPPLLVPGQAFSDWIYRALVLLVISCPCALVISVPLGYFAGMGGAARRGILVKGSQPLDALADARTIVFDKTGTLTLGNFDVRGVLPAPGRTEADVLVTAARAEAGSNHPVAAAIRRAAGSTASPAAFRDSDGVEPAPSFREISGRGVILETGGNRLLAGTAAFLESEGVSVPEAGGSEEGTEVLVAENGAFVGRIRLGDSIRPDAAEALADLRAEGVRRFVLLTGDAQSPAREVARELGIPEVHHGLLPHQKLERLEEILAQEAERKNRTVFVGDGVNDAPVLSRADVGIAMGAGADAALETADVVLMTEKTTSLAEAIRRARRTRSVVRQNIVFALGFKLVFLALGAVGVANMWEAVVADVGVTLLAVLNSTRARYLPEHSFHRKHETR